MVPCHPKRGLSRLIIDRYFNKDKHVMDILRKGSCKEPPKAELANARPSKVNNAAAGDRSTLPYIYHITNKYNKYYAAKQ